MNYLNITFSKGGVYENASNVKKNNPEVGSHLPFSDSSLFIASVVSARQLTTGKDTKIVFDLGLSLKDIDHAFEPGDKIGILPCNPENEVDQLLNRLDVTHVADQQYEISLNQTVKKKNIPKHIPNHGTLRQLFTKNIDIRTPPKKLFLRMLQQYTTNKEEIKRLDHLCSPAGTKGYVEFLQNHRCLLDVLEIFPSCKPPVERILEHLPALHPRSYSIASSPLLKTELHIIFSVVTVDKSMKGVCTGWMEKLIEKLGIEYSSCVSNNLEQSVNNLDINDYGLVQIPFYFRKPNQMRMPKDPSLPIIMVGPGTGVSPFLGFLQHRLLENKEKEMDFGYTWLFFGCRYSNQDFLCKPETNEFLQNGVLNRLSTCFSRESQEKLYVQDIIRKNAKEFIENIMHKNAVVYVSGEAKYMMSDVRTMVQSCLTEFANLSDDDAARYIQDLIKERRYIEDAW